MCSEGCRRSRRAGQQRRRRTESVEEHRDDERERKRESRARAAARACPEGQVSEPQDVPREPMSLADLRGEVLEKIEETLRFWDERERQSLAGLRRQVTGIVGHYLGNLRHGGVGVVSRSLADRAPQERGITRENAPILGQPPGAGP